MPDKHLSRRFDTELAQVSTKLLEMGGLAESQIVCVLEALKSFDLSLLEHVGDAERRLNLMEIAIDDEVVNVIARWQPAASDLRLLMTASKCAANLERVGDEARKIAKRTRRVAMDAGAWNLNITEIKTSGDMASHMLRGALNAFARMDATAAAQIVRDDEVIDTEFRAFVVKLVQSMKEDPRTVQLGLDYLFIAKSIERIGDHATNIAESVVYAVRGTDIRHEHRKQRRHENSGN
ncbi:phosphate signaling complex protein PhoU [Paraburkholderia aromaticivorans]|uniref:Phosphate-specific transport system accessory protein PhoU n=1 Tax=Paraburkholderia aromaticivorans TaxID=2026199 RepID=A0A248VVU8_9BURK|nr:phosphate signaling complex protein PhoU [Paraburkholderia aromaticivorans]ASW03151.1 phosphate transport system regulatory protein PhoU [Paraburkholderia aromaticivorans]